MAWWDQILKQRGILPLEKEIPSKCISYVQPERHITTAFCTNGIDCLLCSWTGNKQAKGSKAIDLGLAFLQQRPPKLLDRKSTSNRLIDICCHAVILLLYQVMTKRCISTQLAFWQSLNKQKKLSCHMLPPLPNAEAVSMSFHSGHRPLKSEYSRSKVRIRFESLRHKFKILQFSRIR